MLTERRARILAHIVGEYVSTALPVGSQTVVRKYGLPISAATVRSEMAKLEEEGYITHPHTSAGRIPSDKGYRYYVESLMEEEDLPWGEKRTIQHQFYQVGRLAEARLGALDEWVRLAAAVLAEAVRNAAFATIPRSPQCRLQHLELVTLHGSTVLLIVVFSGAYVKQRAMSLPEAVSQDELTTIAGRLSDVYAGLTVAQVRASKTPLSPLEKQVVEALAEVMMAEDRALYAQAYLDGVRHILSQPEFAQTDTVLEMLDIFQEGNLLKVIPFDSLPGEGVSVVIGSENLQDAMRRCSVVITRYGIPGTATGALAVLGPTRMRYSRIIPTVRYLSSLMGDMVADYC
jgi:heat-inducible transcriptional repressor